jgi:hypothetical protein
LLDLVVAVGMGTGFLAPLLAPHLGAHVPPAAAMGVFPLVVIPTFAVPMGIMLHVLGLIRLAGESRVGVQPIPRRGGQRRQAFTANRITLGCTSRSKSR